MLKEEIRTREYIHFNGMNFYRYPDSSNRTLRNYYTHTNNDKTGKHWFKLLHVAKWEAHHGPVAKGLVVHHKDGNSLNNELSNLEVMSRSEHSRLHRRLEGAVNTDRLRSIGPLARKRAALVLATKEGKKCFLEACSRAQLNRVKKSFECHWCRKKFLSSCNSGVRFCSKICVGRARRKSKRDTSC